MAKQSDVTTVPAGREGLVNVDFPPNFWRTGTVPVVVISVENDTGGDPPVIKELLKVYVTNRFITHFTFAHEKFDREKYINWIAVGERPRK